MFGAVMEVVAQGNRSSECIDYRTRCSMLDLEGVGMMVDLDKVVRKVEEVEVSCRMEVEELEMAGKMVVLAGTGPFELELWSSEPSSLARSHHRLHRLSRSKCKVRIRNN
jgi:hypothetical protein